MTLRRAALVLVVAACQPPASGSSHAAPPAKQFALLDLVGGWPWIPRVEEEHWRLRSDPLEPSHLVGRYLRNVEVRSTDRVPFGCNQRPWYRQRALFDVVIAYEGNDLVMHETSYTAEDSPCDHGFRHTGTYQVEPHGNRLVLKWPDGMQTLWQTDSELKPLPEATWTGPRDPSGSWRWQATSFDEEGNIHDELEWWEITRRSDTKLDATYRRRVTVRHPEGKVLACAGAPTWTFDDAYVLLGRQKEEEHWRWSELAVEPGDHPCLRTTPKRALDEATAEQIGDFFVFEWRGKRRQILYRPDGV